MHKWYSVESKRSLFFLRSSRLRQMATYLNTRNRPPAPPLFRRRETAVFCFALVSSRPNDHLCNDRYPGAALGLLKTRVFLLLGFFPPRFDFFENTLGQYWRPSGYYFGSLAFLGYPTWWNNVPRMKYLYNNVSASRLLSKLVAIVTLAVIRDSYLRASWSP